MTSLDPSHNPFRDPSGRHAQAVHRSSPSAFPDDLDIDSDSDLGVDDHVRAELQGRRKGRRRVRAAMPPMPDLRFEQSYLLSIRPFLTPRPTQKAVQEKGPAPSSNQTEESRFLAEGAEDDAVFHWGRQVDVNWRMVFWVTLRDQVVSPLFQGALWGWGTLLLVSTASSLRSALYPPSHVPRGRVTGGPGGKIEQAGGGSAVGESGWWRRFVNSWTGGLETAAL